MTLTFERLRESVVYDADTGVFTRNGVVIGLPTTHPYCRIYIDRRPYYAHRLAWFYVYGEWPEGDLDHENEDKTDNRINNLRPSTDTGSQHNKSMAYNNSKTGVLGVSFHKATGLYRADIKANGTSHTIGYFATIEEAGFAYRKAKKVLHPFWTPKGP